MCTEGGALPLRHDFHPEAFDTSKGDLTPHSRNGAVNDRHGTGVVGWLLARERPSECCDQDRSGHDITRHAHLGNV